MGASHPSTWLTVTGASAKASPSSNAAARLESSPGTTGVFGSAPQAGQTAWDALYGSILNPHSGHNISTNSSFLACLSLRPFRGLLQKVSVPEPQVGARMSFEVVATD